MIGIACVAGGLTVTYQKVKLAAGRHPGTRFNLAMMATPAEPTTHVAVNIRRKRQR